jgi:hypothetical protein
MKEDAGHAKAALEAKLWELSKVPDCIQRYETAIKEVTQAVEELRGFVGNDDIPNRAEEVEYLTKISPHLYSKFLFYSKAYEVQILKYRLFLEKELWKIDQPGAAGDPEAKSAEDTIQFQGTKSWIVEGIAALAEAGIIYVNGKKATSVQLVDMVTRALSVDLKDFSHLDYANRLRKKEITPFLSSLIKGYVERAERLNK